MSDRDEASWRAVRKALLENESAVRAHERAIRQVENRMFRSYGLPTYSLADDISHVQVRNMAPEGGKVKSYYDDRAEFSTPVRRRCSDVNRMRYAEFFGEMYAQGFLTKEEFERRSALTGKAQFEDQLSDMTKDLPSMASQLVRTEPRSDPVQTTWYEEHYRTVHLVPTGLAAVVTVAGPMFFTALNHGWNHSALELLINFTLIIGGLAMFIGSVVEWSAAESRIDPKLKKKRKQEQEGMLWTKSPSRRPSPTASPGSNRLSAGRGEMRFPVRSMSRVTAPAHLVRRQDSHSTMRCASSVCRNGSCLTTASPLPTLPRTLRTVTPRGHSAGTNSRPSGPGGRLKPHKEAHGRRAEAGFVQVDSPASV